MGKKLSATVKKKRKKGTNPSQKKDYRVKIKKNLGVGDQGLKKGGGDSERGKEMVKEGKLQKICANQGFKKKKRKSRGCRKKNTGIKTISKNPGRKTGEKGQGVVGVFKSGNLKA